jgi:hypothetical protein
LESPITHATGGTPASDGPGAPAAICWGWFWKFADLFDAGFILQFAQKFGKFDMIGEIRLG